MLAEYQKYGFLARVEKPYRMQELGKVLRSLFEVYDIHGGRRRAEDHHFRGVPKVRVMIHEYAPGNPFKSAGGYPEPKFDEVSRFRVLHVFKDRGGQEAVPGHEHGGSQRHRES